MHCVDLGESFPTSIYLQKIGVDTAENEPLEVWGENSIQYSKQIHQNLSKFLKIVQKYPRKVVTTLGSIFEFAAVFSKKRKKTAGSPKKRGGNF